MGQEIMRKREHNTLRLIQLNSFGYQGQVSFQKCSTFLLCHILHCIRQYCLRQSIGMKIFNMNFLKNFSKAIVCTCQPYTLHVTLNQARWNFSTFLHSWILFLTVISFSITCLQSFVRNARELYLLKAKAH